VDADFVEFLSEGNLTNPFFDLIGWGSLEKAPIKPSNSVQNGITKHVLQNAISGHVIQNAN
jgi:hypothetical protein